MSEVILQLTPEAFVSASVGSFKETHGNCLEFSGGQGSFLEFFLGEGG
jgi:hypothetical protein